MTLFTTLLVLLVERLFKLGEHWQLDHRLEVLFRRVKHYSLLTTLLMTVAAAAVVFIIQRLLQGQLFNIPLLVFWILLGLLCIGPVDRFYEAPMLIQRQWRQALGRATFAAVRMGAVIVDGGHQLPLFAGVDGLGEQWGKDQQAQIHRSCQQQRPCHIDFRAMQQALHRRPRHRAVAAQWQAPTHPPGPAW